MKTKKTTAFSRLSAADRLIIDSYTLTLEGLAAYYGKAFEFVLHDLSSNAPISDFALSLLEKYRKNNTVKPFVSYTSKSKYGKPLRSTIIIIFGEKKRAIGMLYINLHLDSPLTSLLMNFWLVPQPDYVTENFSGDSGKFILQTLKNVRNEVQADFSVPQHRKNKEIIAILYHQGIFRLKISVQIIADNLGISKNTVYLHIRALEK
jgi:predicted transcriptional regulator YheO